MGKSRNRHMLLIRGRNSRARVMTEPMDVHDGRKEKYQGVHRL